MVPYHISQIYVNIILILIRLIEGNWDEYSNKENDAKAELHIVKFVAHSRFQTQKTHILTNHVHKLSIHYLQYGGINEYPVF